MHLADTKEKKAERLLKAVAKDAKKHSPTNKEVKRAMKAKNSAEKARGVADEAKAKVNAKKKIVKRQASAAGLEKERTSRLGECREGEKMARRICQLNWSSSLEVCRTKRKNPVAGAAGACS